MSFWSFMGKLALFDLLSESLSGSKRQRKTEYPSYTRQYPCDNCCDHDYGYSGDIGDHDYDSRRHLGFHRDHYSWPDSGFEDDHYQDFSDDHDF